MKVRSKQQCYLDPETRTTRKTWHPQVKFKGRWCYLPDDTTSSKLMEATDQTTAVEMAIKALREIESKYGGEQG